ncbi:alpha/beta hydrolase [Qipengyuania flava]|nr:alpha/beta hydrolase [Qipengyuania flava]
MMVGRIRAVLGRLGMFVAVVAASPAALSAQESGMVIPLYQEGETVRLSAPETQVRVEEMGETLIFNVSNPTLELFRPAQGTANGAAVIVAPGGGFVAIGYEQGGTAIARRLAELGITALVLKYRTIESSGDPQDIPQVHLDEMTALMARAESGRPEAIPTFAGEAAGVEDGARAVRFVRDHAARWGIDPERIGMLGLSAGAFIAADLATGREDSRPDFIGMLYGGLRNPVPADAPPAFIAAAADDELLPNDSLSAFSAWASAGVPAELHIYEKGGHGFDLRPTGAASDAWFDQFIGWMKARDFLEPSHSTPAPPPAGISHKHNGSR